MPGLQTYKTNMHSLTMSAGGIKNKTTNKTAFTQRLKGQTLSELGLEVTSAHQTLS